MRIVADADILSVEESFATLGELVLLPGREITNKDLRHADVLLVRSITQVNQELLEGSAVKLVGTATSGTDHVDESLLQRRGIRFCAARGCNADAVVDYCFASLSLVAKQRQVNLFDKEFALIGAGHVGRRFASRLSMLGIRCLIHDPLLSLDERSALQQTGAMLVDLNTALSADVISLHVPLTQAGDYPTFHLLGNARLEDLKPACVLLNTSRGPVIDNEQLKQMLLRRKDLSVVFDVWEREPELDQELLDVVAVGTPHIAGYSREAKLRATTWLCQQVTDFLGRAGQSPGLQTVPEMSTLGLSPIEVEAPDQSDYFCAEVLAQAFAIKDLDRQLRTAFSADVKAAVETFDRLRRQLTERREFSARQVVDHGFTPLQHKFLHAMGFDLIPH